MGPVLCALLSSSNKLSTDGRFIESFKNVCDGLAVPARLSKLAPYRAVLKSCNSESNSDRLPAFGAGPLFRGSDPCL